METAGRASFGHGLPIWCSSLERISSVSLSTGVSARWPHSLHTCLQDPGIRVRSRQSHWNLITSFTFLTTSHLNSVTFLLLVSVWQLKGWCRIPSFQDQSGRLLRFYLCISSVHFMARNSLCSMWEDWILWQTVVIQKTEWYMALQSSALELGGLFSRDSHSFSHQIILERHRDILSCFARPRHAVCRPGSVSVGW